VALIIADLLFLSALFSGERVHRSELQTIGRDAAPSIIAAQKIKVAIADMDAEAADELLAKPGLGTAAAKAYDIRREEAAEALITAAQNITYGDAERKPIMKLQVGIGKYEIATQKARDLHERNDPATIPAYQKASELVKYDLLPDADELVTANLDVLESTFSSDTNIAKQTRAAIIVTGMILLGFLVYIQWDLTSRVRRLLNPGLFTASIVTLGLISFALGHLSDASEDLRVARKDAFASLHLLWQARALAYSANADESKYLLENNSALDQSAFWEKAKKIWSRSYDPGYDSPGYLDQELNNITFQGEKEAVDETVKYWKVYLKLDTETRKFKSQGNVSAATQMFLSREQGQMWAFQRFDDALKRTIQINQDAFDSSVTSGFAQLDNFNLTTLIAAFVIGVCGAFGLLVRIREYL
jgi:hypothetical protein